MVSSVFNKFAAGLLIVSVAGLMGCTRDLPQKASLSISLPSSMSSSLGVEKLTYVVINARANPTSVTPKVWQFENQQLGNIVSGSSFTITVEGDIPLSSTLLLQYLGVYEDESTGAMRFSYGKTTVDSTKSGDIVANIVAQMYGSATREGKVAGRYFDNATGPTGPTGTLITYFTPVAGDPPVNISKTEMVAGWFSVFMLDGANMTYKLLEGDKTIFQDVNISSGIFDPNHSPTLSYKKIAKLRRPAGFALETGQTPVRVRAMVETDYVFGFFTADIAGSPVVSVGSNSVCYSDIAQTIPRFYTSLSPAMLPMAYNHMGSVTQMRSVAGGQTETGCSGVPFVDRLSFSPERMDSGGGEGQSIGILPPFQLIDKERSYGGYLNVAHKLVPHADTNLGKVQTGQLLLNWKFLPGTAGAAGVAPVQGVEIYRKASFNGDGGGGGDDERPCRDQLLSRGYVFMADVPHTSETYLTAPFTFGNDLNSVRAQNFAICPYGEPAAGTRRYFVNSASGRLDEYNHDQMFSYGRKIPGETLHDELSITGGLVASFTSYRGATGRIQSVTAVDDYTTRFSYNSTIAGNGNMDVGDEVIVVVSGSRGANSCGEYAGNSIMPGQFTNGRIKAKTTNTIDIKSGTFVDSLIGNTFINTPADQAAFCYVQFVKVAEFGNATLTGSTEFQPNPFNYEDSGGGILAIRVNGTLTIPPGAKITSAYTGYQGTSNNGMGYGGSDPNNSNFGGGGNGDFGGGGGAGAAASGGRGGGISSSLPGMNGGTGFGGGGGSFKFMMGTAGGGSSTAMGGRGGGVLFIAARRIDATGNVFIADGAPGSTPSINTPGAGGGGAGSVNIIADRIIQSGLGVSAKGGDASVGTSATYQHSGGGGGGGFIARSVCPVVSGGNQFMPSVFFNGGNKIYGADEVAPNEALPGGNGMMQSMPPYSCYP